MSRSVLRKSIPARIFVALLTVACCGCADTGNSPLELAHPQASLDKGNFPRVCCFLANLRPTARITAPADRRVFASNEVITFTGQGDDPDEGMLTGGSLVWTSNRDGQIGTGTTFTRTLTNGAHTITLVATDIHGWTGRASIVIYVGVQRITVDTTLTASGLMRTSGARLGANQNGTTVTITSLNPGLFLVAPDTATTGTTSTTVFVPAGQLTFNFTVSGLEGQTGMADVRLSATGFANDSAAVRVVQPAVDIAFLNTNLSLQTPGSNFQVQVGLPLATFAVLPVRAGGVPVTVTVSSSVAAVGEIGTSSMTGPIVTVQIAAKKFSAPATFLTRGVGMTTVQASSPGFLQSAGATQVVTITP